MRRVRSPGAAEEAATPAKGDTLPLLESEFLVSLQSAPQQHANRYKVWNLSLGTDTVCSLDEFSKLAEELDNLQEKYRVSFVISAGNYDTTPLLDFPRSGAQLQSGRITTPADSVLGITVGFRLPRRLQEERTKRTSAICVLPAWRGSKLRNQARPDSLRWIMLDGHPRILPEFAQ